MFDLLPPAAKIEHTSRSAPRGACAIPRLGAVDEALDHARARPPNRDPAQPRPRPRHAPRPDVASRAASAGRRRRSGDRIWLIRCDLPQPRGRISARRCQVSVMVLAVGRARPHTAPGDRRNRAAARAVTWRVTTKLTPGVRPLSSRACRRLTVPINRPGQGVGEMSETVTPGAAATGRSPGRAAARPRRATPQRRLAGLGSAARASERGPRGRRATSRRARRVRLLSRAEQRGMGVHAGDHGAVVLTPASAPPRGAAAPTRAARR